MFDRYFDAVAQQHKECVVYSHEFDSALEERLATRNVTVTHRSLPPGCPDPFVTIREDSKPLGALSVDRLDRMLAPPTEHSVDLETVDADLREAFALFEETLFTSLDRRQLLLASREIEDRGLRIASGTLRVHFQTPRSFEPQTHLYRRFAAETDLSVHLYGPPDWSPPEIDGVVFHPDRDHRLRSHWVLAFDGGPDPTQACALVAREQEAGYQGFWSYDPALVSSISETLTAVP